MDSRTGDLYPTRDAALKAGVPEKDLLMVQGEREAINRVSEVLREKFAKAKRIKL